MDAKLLFVSLGCFSIGMLAPLYASAAEKGAKTLGGKLPEPGKLSSPGGRSGAPPVGVPRGAIVSAKVLDQASDIGEDQGTFSRGSKDAVLYESRAPSVVLVATESGGLGSGSIIDKQGLVLTNWHVVAGHDEVGVLRKPKDSKLRRSDILRARVVRVDEVADLALIRIVAPPKDLVPVKLGRVQDVRVGEDVHAIGHPNGNVWTYTKGLISQIRPGFEWSTDAGLKHRADVIQTQTPINPGNSGGPLFSDSGQIIGVNSFKETGSEAINFAVSVTDVHRLLQRKKDRAAERIDNAPAADSSEPKCETKVLGARRSDSDDTKLTFLDMNCDGDPDAILVEPDDAAAAVELRIDTNGDDQVDVVLVDQNRDKKWDISYHDKNFDGEPDLVGHHPDGKPTPSRMEWYVAKK